METPKLPDPQATASMISEFLEKASGMALTGDGPFWGETAMDEAENIK